MDQDDYGNVIGRGGRTASALRTVIKTRGGEGAAAACSWTSSTPSAEMEASRAGCAPAESAAHTGSTAASTSTIRARAAHSRRQRAVGERTLRITRRAGTDRRPIVRLEGHEDRDGGRGAAGPELLVARAGGA